MNPHPLLRLLGLFMIAAPAAATAQLAAAPAPAPFSDPTCHHDGDGSIRGAARRAADGSLLPAGTVRIYDESLCLTASANIEAGEWKVEGLAAGGYFVAVDPVGDPAVNLVGMLYPDIVCPDQSILLHLSCGTSGGQKLTLAEGQILQGIDFALPRGATLSGQVRDEESGAPVARALLEVRRPEVEHPIRSLEAAADGTYTAAGLAGGSYLLAARSLHHSVEVYGGAHCLPLLAECRALAEPVTVALGEGRTGIDFRLDGLGAIAGTVRDDISHAPLSGVLVEAFAIDGSGRFDAAESDEAGHFLMANLTAENFYVVAKLEGYRKEIYPDTPFSAGLAAGRLVTVSPARTTSGIDFELTLLGSIRGRVTARDPLQTVRRCTISIWKVGDNGWNPSPAYAPCEADGAFFATGLEAGAYRVGTQLAYPFAPAIYGIGSCNWDTGVFHCDLAQAPPVVVRNGETTENIDLELDLGGRIHGRTLLADDGGPNSRYARVLLYQDDGQLVDVRFQHPQDPPDFEFWELAPGSYRITVDGGNLWQSQAFGGAACSRWYCPPSRSLAIDLEGGETFPGADFTLAKIPAYQGCTPSAEKLCLNRGRFEITASWRDFLGQTGRATALPFNDLTGSFYFFSENNIEVVVKALNGCSPYLGHHWWIFGAGLTNVEAQLEVRDTLTGLRKTYSNALGQIFVPILDTAAFDTCDALEPSSAAPAQAEIPTADLSAPEPCRDDATGHSLCLAGGRFRITAQGKIGSANYPARSQFLAADTMAFSFFEADNLELMIKVLSTCGQEGPGHWIFLAGLTDVETVITVKDVVSGETHEYRSGPGPFAPVYDFATFGPESCGG